LGENLNLSTTACDNRGYRTHRLTLVSHRFSEVVDAVDTG